MTGLLVALLSALPATADDPKPREVAGWGTVVDPDGDCEAKLVGDALTLTVPATPHNLNPLLGRMNGPRVLRPVAGDFTAKVRVGGKFQPGPNKTSAKGAVPFVGAGLLVWADKDHFVRVERCAWWLPDGRRVGYPPLVEAFVGGEFQVFSRPPAPAGGDVWLRVDRAGDAFTVRTGPDGTKWEAVAEFTAALPAKVRVGVSAVNTSDAAFAATFGGFKVVADD